MTHYHCHRCDVTWATEPGERVPDTCWVCEQSDETHRVRMQCGRPVLTEDGKCWEGVGL